MSKFNLKNYQKSNGDLHTDKALSVDHTKAPNSVTDKQLSKNQHSDTPNHLTEKQLDKLRVEDPAMSIEGRLNKAKGSFGVKHRNEDSYKGNINKLEEKRVAGDKTEDEKYEVASQTNKKMKWWETKTNDGLKLASATFRKLAYGDESIIPERDRGNLDDAFEEQESGLVSDRMDNDAELEPTTVIDPLGTENGKNPLGTDDGDDFAITDGAKNQDVWIASKKDPLPHPPFSDKVNADQYAAFYQIGFDPLGWTDEGTGKINEMGVRKAVVEKFLELRPDLEGLINPNSPEIQKSLKRTNDGNGYYNIRLLGDQFINSSPELSGTGEQIDVEFSLTDFDETDVGGTTMAVGKVLIPENLPMEDEELLKAVRDYVAERHPDLVITEDAIQMSADGASASFAVPVDKKLLETKRNPPPEDEEFTIVDDMSDTSAPEAPPEDEEFEIIDDMGDMNQDPNKSASSQDRILLSQVDKKKLKR